MKNFSKSFIKLLLCSISLSVQADVSTDGSLGSVVSLNGKQLDIPANLGERHGENLFHSFSQFNIETGQTVTFQQPQDNPVNNVINRITGGQASQINGDLVSEIPNVYLINPNGISFGEKAELNITGSFYVSTANAIYLQDGNPFYTNLTQKSLLTSAPPEAFGFIDNKPGKIFVTSQSLQLDNGGQTLSLVGGDIHISDALLSVRSGHIQLVSVAAPPAQVDKKVMIRQGQLFVEEGGLGNIQIDKGTVLATENPSKTVVNTSNVSIYADSLEMIDAYSYMDKPENSDAYGFNASNIHINVRALKMKDASIHADAQQEGHGGNIWIGNPALKLTMTGRSQISAANSKGLEGGNINILANTIEMDNNATINASNFSKTGGKGGTISITANTLTMKGKGKTRGSAIFANSFTSSEGGSLNLVVNKELRMSEEAIIAGVAFSSGEGGQIKIETGNAFSLKDNALILGGTVGSGTGGNVSLTIGTNNDMSLINMANISTESGHENEFIQSVKREVAYARQLGATINADLFAGGGQPGQLDIRFMNFNPEDLLKKGIRLGNQEFSNCPLNNNHVINRMKFPDFSANKVIGSYTP